ncbi:MAG TPA: 3-isopropylmalate dehydrogenase [Dehalococcoidia bacterium]|nr:3-isopropylmalate dehydrogenase [Dehalococcoidia bacterium]
MSVFNIAVLPGDYIGPEITGEARKVLEAAGRRFGHEFRFHEALAGGAAYDVFGEHLPPVTLQVCEEADAILKGPFGGPRDEINHPKWQGVEQNAILPLRKHFDLYLNLRPVVVPDALLDLSPLKPEFVRGTDMLILRELSSGIYFGPRGERQVEGPRETMQREVWDTEQYNEYEIERIVRDGFRLAQARRKKLTLIAKSNVMSTGLFWREVAAPIAKEYPDVAMDYLHVDAASMELIVRPTQFDVIVTSNIFGDILSDEAAGLLRSLGMGPSASLNEKGFGLYEPIHGSAPDIMGQGKANPLACILSAAMMLRLSFDLPEVADAVESAVNKVLAEGARTPDIASPGEAIVTTQEMGRRVAEGL